MANNYTSQILESYGYTPDQINADYSTPQLLQKTIGLNGVAGVDYNFAADAATHDPQILDLGLIIPYQWHIKLVIVECIEAVAGVAGFNIAAGCSIACVTVPIVPLAGLGNTTQSVLFPPSNNDLVRHFYFLGDPTSLTWDDMTAGKWQLTILFDDYSKL